MMAEMDSFTITGAITTALIHGSVAVALLGISICGDASASDGPKLKMTTIEASLAYKSPEQTRQPQKRRKRPTPKAKPDGVSRDETKQPEPKKKKPEETEPDFEKEFERLKQLRQRDVDEPDEMEEGEEIKEPGGKFDGSEHGFAEVDKGDPYMRELAADVYSSWSVPTLQGVEGNAVGCVRLEASGKVPDTKIETKSGNANVDRSVKVALDKLAKKRTKAPQPVPKHLLDVTTRWICFKFNV